MSFIRTGAPRPVSTVSTSLGDRAYLGLVLLVILVALVCGGGTRHGLWSDALVQIVSLPLLAVACSRIMALPSRAGLRLPLILILAVALVPVLQLIPLPPSVWTALPGRGEVAEAYAAAGIPLPFLPISMEPLATLRSAFSLLPVVAVFLGVVCLRDAAEFDWIVLVIFCVAIVGSGLELLQLAGGHASPLRFYKITNAERGVGFLANSNHQAAFLCATIPYAAAWGSLAWAGSQAKRVFRLTFAAILLVVLIVGVVATRSRFGLLLALLAGLASIPLVASITDGATRRGIVQIAGLANAVALLLAFQFGFVGIADRLSQSVSNDIRWRLASVTAGAVKDYFPLGSGIGTYTPIYQRYEPLQSLTEWYVNRAHNDWLEWWLEGGLISGAVLCALLLYYLFLTYRVWRLAPGSRLVAYGRAGSLCVGLLLVHSIVDYPLRTAALAVMVSISCAFMLRVHLERSM